jgi:beta-glucosidase
VTFTLGPEELKLLDQDLQWKVVPGTFDVMIGKSSADIALKGSFEVRDSNSTSSARLFQRSAIR